MRPFRQARSLIALAALLAAPLAAQAQADKPPDLSYWHVWADDQGVTHQTKCALDGFSEEVFAPPEPPSWVRRFASVGATISIAVMPVGWEADWHKNPKPQWIIPLSGSWYVETMDGTRVEMGPGEISFGEDQLSKADDQGRFGHLSGTAGDMPVTNMVVQLDLEPTAGSACPVLVGAADRLRRCAMNARLLDLAVVALSAFALTVGGSASAAETTDGDNHVILVEADAHEGPVVVPSQNRLYFTSVPDRSADDPSIAIRYVDLDTLAVETFKPRSNMANGMWLTRDGSALLVAEQGTMDSPGGISRIDIDSGERQVLVDSFEGKPFNSPNKVIEASNGWIYFSDPDYGANQGFKPPPQLPQAVYAL